MVGESFLLCMVLVWEGEGWFCACCLLHVVSFFEAGRLFA